MSEPVLLLTGPPGAGKTATARVLAARSGRSVHLEADLFFEFVRSGQVEPWRRESHRQNVIVMQAVAAAAASYACGGYFTIVEGIILPAWFLEPLRDALTTAGHAVSYAVLRPSLPTCLSRAAARTEELSDPNVIAQLWDGFADLGPLEEHVIISEGAEVEMIADAVLERLHQGQLAV